MVGNNNRGPVSIQLGQVMEYKMNSHNIKTAQKEPIE